MRTLVGTLLVMAGAFALMLGVAGISIAIEGEAYTAGDLAFDCACIAYGVTAFYAAYRRSLHAPV